MIKIFSSPPRAKQLPSCITVTQHGSKQERLGPVVRGKIKCKIPKDAIELGLQVLVGAAGQQQPPEMLPSAVLLMSTLSIAHTTERLAPQKLTEEETAIKSVI